MRIFLCISYIASISYLKTSQNVTSDKHTGRDYYLEAI